MKPTEPLHPGHAPRLLGTIGLVVALAVMYVARDVLIPLVLGVLLSFLTAPLAQLFRRGGLARIPATFVAVCLPLLAAFVITGSMARQVTELVNGLPKYEATLRDKLDFVESSVLGDVVSALRSLRTIWTDAEAGTATAARATSGASEANRAPIAPAGTPIAVEVRERAATTYEVIGRLLPSILQSLGLALIVLLVWTFALLERESLRDRFIRLTSSGGVHRTTFALDEAATRLSRLFLTQFCVNITVGLLVAAGLGAIGVPGAILLGAAAAALRFLPFVGICVAAVLATVLAAAVDPGWSSAILVVALFLTVEFLVGNIVEPLLYGRMTGLSPVAVAISAIFWGWIWGPAGVLLATPLTLCLVVLGRHVRALKFLEILLGDEPALDLHQNFYQRILSGDSAEVIERGRQFLLTKGFVAYCDSVVLPALQLATSELSAGVLSPAQAARAERTFEVVINRFTGGAKSRAAAEMASATIVCVALDDQADEMAAKLLVRALKEAGLNSKVLPRRELGSEPRSIQEYRGVQTILLVSIVADAIETYGEDAAHQARRRFPNALLVGVFRPSFYSEASLAEVDIDYVDCSARSVAETIDVCLDRKRSAASHELSRVL